jgi:hypothetical protein
LTVASTTGAGFSNFMTPSMSRNSTGSPLMMRPAQSIFFEIEAVLVSDCMNFSSGCAVNRSREARVIIVAHTLASKFLCQFYPFEALPP